MRCEPAFGNGIEQIAFLWEQRLDPGARQPGFDGEDLGRDLGAALRGQLDRQLRQPRAFAVPVFARHTSAPPLAARPI